MNRVQQVVGVLASGALHSLVWLVLPRGSVQMPSDSEVAVDLELRYAEPAAEPAVASGGAAPRVSEPAPALAVQRTPRRPADTSASAEEVHEAVSTVPSVPEQPTRQERGPSGSAWPARIPFDLSPLAVARTLVDVRALPPKADDKSSAAEIEAERKLEYQLGSAVPDLSRTSFQRGKETLDNGAMDAVTLALRPWKAIMEPLSDGRYQYRGQSFDAVILSDGRVQYQRKTGVGLSVVQSASKDFVPGSPVPSLDFQSLFARATGDQLALGERKRFLERTRGLRDLLVERARRQHMQTADGRIDKLLRQVLAAHSERAAKHDAVFELWLECSDDEVGMLGRRHIERTLRQLCPRDSTCGFRPEDLARLNARRGPRAPFNPYAEDMPSEHGEL